MPVLIPGWPWNGVQRGCLGSGTPKLIPRGYREGRCGIENARFEPEKALEGGLEGVIGLRNGEIAPAATFMKG